MVDVHEKTVEAVSFSHENVSAVQKLDDHEDCYPCECEGVNAFCERCNGHGTLVLKIKGWKHSKVLATNVQEFIMKGIKKAWNL